VGGLNSTQVAVEDEVGVELGNNLNHYFSHVFLLSSVRDVLGVPLGHSSVVQDLRQGQTLDKGTDVTKDLLLSATVLSGTAATYPPVILTPTVCSRRRLRAAACFSVNARRGSSVMVYSVQVRTRGL